MKCADARIFWNVGGEVQVVSPSEEDPRHLRCSGGACYAWWTDGRGGGSAIAMLLREFVHLTMRDKLSADDVHREFLKIDEYAEFLSLDVPGVLHSCLARGLSTD